MRMGVRRGLVEEGEELPQSGGQRARGGREDVSGVRAKVIKCSGEIFDRGEELIGGRWDGHETRREEPGEGVDDPDGLGGGDPHAVTTVMINTGAQVETVKTVRSPRSAIPWGLKSEYLGPGRSKRMLRVAEGSVDRMSRGQKRVV